MKPLSFGPFFILAPLLCLVQSIALPPTNASKTTSVVQPSRNHLHTGSKSHNDPWRPERTIHRQTERTRPGDLRREEQIDRASFQANTIKPLTLTRADSHSTGGAGLLPTGESITTLYDPEITSYPISCTVDVIVCLAGGADEYNPTRTHSSKDSQRALTTEHAINTHKLCDTNSFRRPIHTNIIHLTPHLDKIHPRDECDRGCSDGYVCNTSDRTFIRFCARESHILTITTIETPLPHNTHVRTDDGDSDTSYCLPTANINANAVATCISSPVHCTSRTIDLGLLGYRNVTSLGCTKPLEPHEYGDGSCLCEPALVPNGGSPDMTGSLRSTISRTALSQIAQQTMSSHLISYSSSHVNITGACRVEQNVDAPDGWNSGDLVIDNTRYICAAGSLPLPFFDGTCDCVLRPTRYDEPTETTQKLRTTFSAVHVTRRELPGAPVETVTYHPNMSSYPTIFIAADAAISTATAQYGLSTSVVTTSVEMTAFSFNPEATGASTSLYTTTSFRLPTGISEIDNQMIVTAIRTSLDCPTDPQIINVQHPKPSSNGCPVIVQVATGEFWGNMSTEYSSLDEFCYLLRYTNTRAYLPEGFDLEPVIQLSCQGVAKREAAVPQVTLQPVPAQSINLSTPKPPSNTEEIYIELLVGKVSSGRFDMLYYPEGLSAFCRMLRQDGAELDLPKGVDKNQVLEECCQGLDKTK